MAITAIYFLLLLLIVSQICQPKVALGDKSTNAEAGGLAFAKQQAWLRLNILRILLPSTPLVTLFISQRFLFPLKELKA